MKRTRLKRQPKFIKGKTWISVFIIVIPTVMASALFWYGKQVDRLVVTKTVYAQVPEYKFVMPELNPDISEREQNIDLIKKIWGKDREIGLAIARCESGYRTHAIGHNTNGTVDQGIFQMNSVHDMPEMENSVANISTAYLMFKQQGTTPWNSSAHCWGGQI